MNLSIELRKKLVFYAILIYGFISILQVFDHYNIFLISDKYFFWLATIMLAIPFTSVNGNNIPNYWVNQVFLGLFIYMATVGIMKTENTMSAIFQMDFFDTLRFMLCILIGFHREFFTTIKKAMMIIMLVGIVTNLISLTTSDTFVRALTETKSLTYKVQYMLLPGLFYLFLYDTLNKNERRIVVTAVIVYAVEQVLFQKRLPSLRIILTLLAYVYSMRFFHEGGLKFSVLLKRIFLFIIGVILAVQLFALFGFDLGEYADLLFKRFYQEDTVGETIEEDARWTIGESFFTDLHLTGEFFSGRGFGGVVYDNSFLQDDANGNPYRSAAEMGIPTMMLKGGVMLVLFITSILIMILKLFKTCKKNVYLFAAFTTVIIWFMFLYAEGFIGNYYSIFEILLGYSIGLVLSAAKNNGENFEPNENY